MIFVGLDPGSHTGWAILSADGSRIASGTWDLSARRPEGGGMRFLRCRTLLGELFNSHIGDRALAYEEVRRHLGVDAAHVYGGIVAVVQALCEERSVPYRGIPVGTAKKLATGKGNADKAAMMAAAVAHWRLAEVGEDEADALWIAETLRRELAP